jgi:DNA-binding NtrC family response regulator
MQYAGCDASVLITGETGTGKEVFARAIHYGSARTEHPFVPVNCGALPGDLVENELFGHESEAFTGARHRHSGLVQEAQTGTLFLDEIEALPLVAQATLLRFLQDHQYRSLGGNGTRTANVRIISASNAELSALIVAGKFRQDLFYRLNVLTLNLPPLRERREDIPLLAQHLLARCRDLAQPPPKFSPAAMTRLRHYHWPRNVRELENVIRRAIVLSGTNTIEEVDLDLPVNGVPAHGHSYEFSLNAHRSVGGHPRKASAEDLLAVLGHQALGRQEWFARVRLTGMRLSLRTFARREAELKAAGKIVCDHQGNSHRAG